MKGNFEACISFIERDDIEGGNDKANPETGDPRTSRGITQPEYDAWQHLHNGVPGDVFKAPQAVVDAIYLQSYWLPYCDLLPRGIDLMYFDTAVNEGPSKAVLFLQRALGITDDGHFGVVTAVHLKAVSTDPKGIDSLISAIADERRADYRRMRRLFRVYGAGWLARVDKCRTAALEMAHGLDASAKVVS